MKRIEALAGAAGAFTESLRPLAAQTPDTVTVGTVNSVAGLLTADVPLATVVDKRFVDHANAVLGARR